MTATATASPLPESAAARPVVAVLGHPNTGKSTLFNRLTGLRQKVGNYPGVTVEKHVGSLSLEAGEVQLVDLPGTYSLAAHSPDEMVALDVLLGRIQGMEAPSAAVVVVDASDLRRHLYLVSQVLELGLPVVVALNLMDLAAGRGVGVDPEALADRLRVPVVPLVANRGEGLEALRGAIEGALSGPRTRSESLLPEIEASAAALAAELSRRGPQAAPVEVLRALIDRGGAAERRFLERFGPEAGEALVRIRGEAESDDSLEALEGRRRHRWASSVLDGALTEELSGPGFSDRVDRWVGHPVVGMGLFLLVMGLVFQAVFAWAQPLMDLIDGSVAGLGQAVGELLPPGALSSLVADGVIAGVGSVVVFLPQILILFAFIIFLEDSGYMARAAFLMDRVMRRCGLSGQSFIPMLSSFACAVPGILATRVIADRRDRLATVLAAPFMTCSARLPVYALLISAFVPRRGYAWGLVSLQGLVLLGLYLLGILAGVATALVLKRTLLRGPAPSFLMEMPPYRWPDPRSVALQLWQRGRVFLVRAGTVIFTVSVAVWALAYFPHPEGVARSYDGLRAEAEAFLSGDALGERLAALDGEEASAYLEQSLLGRLSRTVAPVFEPLGWDWRVSAAALASFPAREVVLAVLGTLYAVGSDAEDEGRLTERIRAATWPDGRPVFTLPMALGLMVFYAFCLQCAATVATIRRETGSWRWPVFAWVYMTGLAYVGAFATYQIGRLVAGGS